MTFRPELIDELLKEYRKPEDLMRFSTDASATVHRSLSAQLPQLSHLHYQRY